MTLQCVSTQYLPPVFMQSHSQGSVPEKEEKMTIFLYSPTMTLQCVVTQYLPPGFMQSHSQRSVPDKEEKMTIFYTRRIQEIAG